MDWKYVTRGRGVVKESATFGLLTLLSFTIIPIFMILGYFYQSYLNLIRGKTQLPKWDLGNTFVKGLVVFGYMLGLTIFVGIILLPLLLLDSVAFLIGVIILGVLTTYLFPLLILSHEIDMDLKSVATSGNYLVGLTLSIFVFIGAYIATIVVYTIVYVLSLFVFVTGAISLSAIDPALLIVAFIIFLLVLIPAFVLLNGGLYVALHMSLIPLGEKLNEEIFDGRSVIESSNSNGDTDSTKADEWVDM